MKKDEIINELTKFYETYKFILNECMITEERWLRWLSNFDTHDEWSKAYSFIYKNKFGFLKYVHTAHHVYEKHKDLINWTMMRLVAKTQPQVIELNGTLVDIKNMWVNRPIKKKRRNE